METGSVQAAGEEYARIRMEYQADAWLYGTVTAKEFTRGKKPELDPSATVADGDYVAESHAPLYFVSVDTEGEIGWKSGTFRTEGRPDAHVIEILTGRVSQVYRAYLQSQGVSYIIAGEDSLDMGLAVKKLYRLFGIGMLMVCGGGTINWSFLQWGLVDELSLLIAPAADGEDNVALFEKSRYLAENTPVEFRLENVEKLRGDTVRLVYTVKKKNHKEKREV